MSNDSKMEATEPVAIRYRIKQVLIGGLLLFLLGVAYGLFVKTTGLAIPCIFHLITGWKCPGCGVTRMCVALLQMDIRGAFYWHPMLLIQLPILGWIFFRNIIAYVKNGVCRLTRLENICVYICIALLLVFTVLRNLFP
ncbi:MAG: DUF2752 domain-containing protein [Lachnospiraceae bacterium]|nr:DUF2752 domain-containing protein [Lachnospiraceae bacterium]